MTVGGGRVYFVPVSFRFSADPHSFEDGVDRWVDGKEEMSTPLKIMDNLWQVGGPGLSSPDDASCYLLRCDDNAALIDAGCGQGHDAIIRNIAQCLPKNVPVGYLFLTHCHFDHAGGAARLRDALGSKIVVHALDAVFLESGDSEVTAASWYGSQMESLSPDLTLQGGRNTVAVGHGQLTVLHWPGHSPGSVVLTTRLDDLVVLFGQDVHGPIHPALRSDEGDYQASLRMLLNLDADLLLEGHYGIFHGKDRVRTFIRSFLD